MEAHGATIGAAARAEAQEVAVERVRALVMRYFIASTLFLLVAGALGIVMRQSQGDLLRVGDNFFYAAMTAHGLGAFVAWAGFGIMGFGFWVLRNEGFAISPLGCRLADLTWWTMVIGTLGIVVSTLVLGFAASWVFLYPLPFHSSGQWGDAAEAMFSVSVLLAGVAILAWCASIIVIV